MAQEFPLVLHSRRTKVIHTILLYVGCFLVGTYFALVGPTLLDLEIITGATTEAISFVFTARASFGLLGVLINGLTIERLNPWCVLAACSLLVSAAYIAVPFCAHLVAMVAVFGVAGFGGFVFSANANFVLLNIWGDDHGSWMQGLHATFAAGALVGPLIAKPFLTEIDRTEGTLHPANDDEVATTPQNVTSLYDSTVEQMSEQEMETDVENAYYIVGTLCLASCIMFTAVFMVGKRQIFILWTQLTESHTEKKVDFTRPQKTSFTVKLAALVFGFYLCYCLLEINYANFLLVYAVKHLNWTKSMAASVTAAYWGSFMIGRFAGILIIKHVTPQVLLLLEVIVCFLSLLPIPMFGQFHVAVLWACTIVLGFSMSTIYATGITWTERYISVSGRISSLFLVAGALGELSSPLLVRLSFRGIGAWSFIYFLIGISGSALLVLVIMQVFANRHGERYYTRDVIVLNMKTTEAHCNATEKGLPDAGNIM